MGMPVPDWKALARTLARPRYRILLGVALFFLVVRIALPYALRPIVVLQADAALTGRIALADLDLSLIRGGVTLRGLEVHADELPAASPPLFDAQRLWVQVSWLALLGKTLRVEELELDGFHVRLERTAAGLTLPGPAPTEAAEDPAPEEPEPEPESGSGWSLAADGVWLRDGAIAFVDHTTGAEPRRFDLAVKDLSAENLELALGAVEDDPGRVALRAEIGEGSIGLDARVESRSDGPALTSTVVLSNLPLAGLQAYLPMFGWSDLQARLDAELVHRFESAGAHEVSGRIALSDVAVRVPELERPALAWQRLDVALDKVDLVAQHAGVAEVALRGARIPIDLRAALPLPLLTPPPMAVRAAEPESAEPAQVSTAGEPSPPWTWRVARVVLEKASIEMLGAGEPLPLVVDLEVKDLDGAPASRWPLRLGLAAGGGTLDVDGALAIAPLAFEGSLAIADLPLPVLLARVPAPGAELLRAGKARADLRIALTPREGASAPTSDLRVSGTVGLAGLDVGEPATAREFGATWKDLQIGIRELAVADVLALGGPGRIALTLDELRLAEPSFTVTRTAEGLVLPVLAGVATAEPAQPPATASPAPAQAAPQIVVDVSRLRIDGARARILDRSVTPAFRSQLDRVDVGGSGLRWPGPRAERVAVTLRGLAGARLDANGSVKPDDSKLTVKLSQLALAQFNPYVTSSGFSVNAGSLAFDAEARFAPGGYDSSTGVIVSQLDLGGAQGASLFQETFGIPLSVALGLLKDLKGDISLSVPIAGAGGETRVALARIVGQALRKALVGALASPLKLLGAVITSDGKVQALAPAPIPFPDGSAELGPEGAARIAELADLLAASPGVSLTLTGGASEADARVLRERAILAELRAATGVRALGALGEIGTRNAVRAYLEQLYAAGPSAELAAEQRAWLDARVRAQPPAAAELESLANARVTAVRLALSAAREIAPDRLAPGSPAGEPGAQASVAVELGTPDVAAP
jgi:hypothetical protein